MMQAPTREEVLAAFREAEEEQQFWDGCWEHVRAVYAGEFVAAHDGEIVAHAADFEMLLDELESRGIAPGHAFVRYVPAPGETLLL